jgi:hypothetical protein
MCFEAVASEDRERFRELTYRPRATRQLAQHPPARSVAGDANEEIQLKRHLFNHVVECRGACPQCQPNG